jgi:flagellar M-ring protein FliF
MAENNVQNQVKSFYGNLSLLQKVSIVIVPIIVIGGLIALFMNTSTKEQAVLFSGLDNNDAGKIIENLKTNLISYELRDNGSTILVNKDIVMDTRLTLASEGLPETSVVGYELFDKTNLGMSEFVQKLNYRRALEGELSKTISSIDEVVKARVHIVIPDNALFSQDQKNPTASVTLQLKSGRNMNQKIVEGIQTLVASSVEGMSTNNVSIIDHKGKLLSVRDTDNSSSSGLTSQQLEQQRKVEEHLTNKAQSMLDNVLGVGNANVKLNAELDFTRIEQTKTDYDPERQVLRSEQTTSETTKSTDSLYYLAVVADRNVNSTVNNYEISQNVEVIAHSVGNIKRLSVAAVINSIPQMIDSGGMKSVSYKPRTDEEMQKLTDIIKNAVGYDPSRNDVITVNNVQFDTNLEDYEIETAPALIWYEEPYNQKMMVLISIIILTMFLMYKFMQSNMIKDRIRIALSLPNKGELSGVDIDSDSQQQNILNELSFDENLMLLPSELPEQLLLEGESKGRINDSDNLMLESSIYPDKNPKMNTRISSLKYNSELDEENMMKIEIKNKVQEFIDNQSEDAARLIKIMISQDQEDKAKK